MAVFEARGSKLKKALFALEQTHAAIARRRQRWKAILPYLDPSRLAPWSLAHHDLGGRASPRRNSGPCVFDGPINGQSFRAWIDQQRLDTIKPGDIVVMDNLGSHKAIESGRAIRAKGASLWYLRAYSPDLNSIEQTFSKIKHWMRMAQRRTVEETWRHVGQLV